MSQVTTQPATAPTHGGADHGHGHDAHGDHAHNPHLAHHFDTPEQQFATGKTGMWVFLATEILMFGGLFCAYSVYRANHPEVFLTAHKELDTTLGFINTLILITSSLTMAWGVRAAQLGQKKLLVGLLVATLFGGVGFMCIKSIEYYKKYHHHLWLSTENQFHPEYKPGADAEHGTNEMHRTGDGAVPAPAQPAPVNPGQAGTAAASTGRQGEHSQANSPDQHAALSTSVSETPAVTRMAIRTEGWADPNAGTPDEAKIKPQLTVPAGLAASESHSAGAGHGDVGGEHHGPDYGALPALERERLYTFFQIYFAMTGLHGLHVLVGMGLIAWILVRSMKGEFGPDYFTPVDLVGLYWHLVDLIWIFLFPLLYLIH